MSGRYKETLQRHESSAAHINLGSPIAAESQADQLP
jgi:hypothetical protein